MIRCQGCKKAVDETLWHWDPLMTPDGSANTWVVVRQGSLAVAYINANEVADPEGVARLIVESVNARYPVVK